MLTIRDDSLSLDYLRTKPNSDELMEAILTEESFAIWDNTPERRGARLVNEAVKRATGASLAEVLYLVDLLDEYESAITYDCLSVGMRLRLIGTHEFSWGELLAIVQFSPRHSAFYRAQFPEEWMWDATTQLLASIYDEQRVSNWIAGSGKRNTFPKQLPRPGVTDDAVKKFGKDAIPYDEMADWLGGGFEELQK